MPLTPFLIACLNFILEYGTFNCLYTLEILLNNNGHLEMVYTAPDR
jgi:hypothetical protein